jgi:cytochrome c
MFDTMTFTKVLGGFCGALLIYLLGGWAAESLYHTGHHGEGYEQAYVIETDTGGEAAEPEEEVDFVQLVAAADPGKGERVWGKCRACHALDGTDGTGPHLNGVVNRSKASVDGFSYSDALTAMSGEVWDAEALNGFLESPRSYAPGTSMGFAGLNKVEDRANLVAYLETTGS